MNTTEIFYSVIKDKSKIIMVISKHSGIYSNKIMTLLTRFKLV